MLRRWIGWLEDAGPLALCWATRFLNTLLSCVARDLWCHMLRHRRMHMCARCKHCTPFSQLRNARGARKGGGNDAKQRKARRCQRSTARKSTTEHKQSRQRTQHKLARSGHGDSRGRPRDATIHATPTEHQRVAPKMGCSFRRGPKESQEGPNRAPRRPPWRPRSP